VLGTQLDAANLMRSARLREGHGFPSDEVLALAIRGGRWLGAAERRALAYEPVEQWAAHLGGTPYADALAGVASLVELQLALARRLAREANHGLAGTPFELGFFLGYLALAELQAMDLRRLLEGKRMGRPESWLRAGLVAARAAA
jgi:hypothetical protein